MFCVSVYFEYKRNLASELQRCVKALIIRATFLVLGHKNCKFTFIFFSFFQRFVPESVRYLRVNGRLDESMAIFAKIAKVNGRQMPDGYLLPPEDCQVKSSILDLFRPFSLAINTFIQMFAW